MAIPIHWRLRYQRYALLGSQCPNCMAHHYPPRDVCPDCSQIAREAFPVLGPEEGFSFNILHLVPDSYPARPLVPVVVE